VTLSAYVKGTPGVSLSWTVVQNFGAGGSSLVTALNPSPVVLSAAWVRVTATGTVPSIAGKTIGAGSYLETRFGLISGATGTVEIAQVQLEAGPLATPFEERPVVLGLALAKRFFERVGGTIADTHVGKGFADSTTAALVNLDYAEKRVVPSIAVAGAASDFEVQRQGAAVVATTALAATAGQIGLKSCQLAATVAAGLTAGEGVGLKAKGTAGTIDVSAEL